MSSAPSHIIVSGSGVIAFDRKETKVHQGDVVFIPPKEEVLLGWHHDSFSSLPLRHGILGHTRRCKDLMFEYEMVTKSKKEDWNRELG